MPAVGGGAPVSGEPDAQVLWGLVDRRRGDDFAAPGSPWSEDAMEKDVVLPGGRDDGEEALEQLAAGEEDRGGTVRPGRLQAKENRSVGLLLEPFSTDRRTS